MTLGVVFRTPARRDPFYDDHSARTEGRDDRPFDPEREDDISFYLFQASSADAVRESMTRAGLRSDRITEAVSIQTKPTRLLQE